MKFTPFRIGASCGLFLAIGACASCAQPLRSAGAASTITVEQAGKDAGPSSSRSSDGARLASPTQREAAQRILQMGLTRGQAGDFSGAIAAFEHALEIWPGFAEAHYNLGLALIAHSGNLPAWKDALAEFKAALAARPDYPHALRMAGVCLLESGQASEAIPELKAALRLEPTSAETHFDLGRALEATGKRPDASSEYRTALKDRHPYPEADSALGRLLFAKRDCEGAGEHFNAALAANPDLESAHYGLAEVLRAEGKKAESAVELQQAKLLLQRQADTVMSSHLSNQSLDRARTGDIPAAIDLARKAVWLDPANALANFNLGLLLADAGNLEASMSEIRKAISLAPFRTVFYVNLARVQERANDRNEAMNTLRRAMQMDPADPDIQICLKQLETSNLRNPQHCSSAVADPFPFGAPSDTADGHFAFATQLSKEGDFVGAIGEMLRALMLAPTRSDIRYNLAIAEIQIGQYDRAESELRSALRLSPDSVATHIALGSLLFQARDLAKAASEFRKALALEPGNQQAARLLRECQSSVAR
jgi:protein O-GlcNAc transferase